MKNITPVLINDERLNASLIRTASGKTMLFYHSQKDREPAFEIEAPEPELQAKLIEGQWYWVNSCEKCNGNKVGFNYAVCDKHNCCVSCGMSRKELTDTPWGHREGFICKPCHDRHELSAKIEALTKAADAEHDEWDYQDSDKPLCPHCATELYYEAGDRREGKNDCETCGGSYELTVEYSPSFTTAIIGEKVTLENMTPWENKQS
jgi:hypothetical protein